MEAPSPFLHYSCSVLLSAERPFNISVILVL